jgi:RNA polymerase sigma-70 factor (ECF subfamily)
MTLAERQAFEAFYAARVGLVRAVLFRMCGAQDLDDLTQDVFVKAWAARDAFAGNSERATWLYRIAMNHAIDSIRRRAREKLRASPTDVESLAASSGKNHLMEMAIARALELLSPEMRSVAVLHYYQDLDLTEIASVLEIPLGTVKSRLHAARQKLETLLDLKKEADHERA